MSRFNYCALVLFLLGTTSTSAQSSTAEPSTNGPNRDLTFQLVWLIESDDANRIEYDGAARAGLSEQGFDRLVPAGSAMAPISVGEGVSVRGDSRYGQMSVTTSMLNTTEPDEVQVRIELKTTNQSPVSIQTSTRVPLGRWFLVGAADSRVGIPLHADDGKRSVVIMKVQRGPILLD
ncbi:hypothetical protein FYK55_04015 [Roseiconus nitratireducens]|uniref:Uncharacterized protein n=1 Tax=Roseiconus nitratireducens TaxID=2605748 RepID=A0A5M6DL49_9BACT|nr:hypothetical protein [Roseiconus nitratireducens]KAA5546075.1 hypothetical protein FYK55_04015 [Roseiconus nitratireducens]